MCRASCYRVPGLSVISDEEVGDTEEDNEDSVDTNSVPSAKSRLDNLVQNAGESKPGPKREEEAPETGSEGRNLRP